MESFFRRFLLIFLILISVLTGYLGGRIASVLSEREEDHPFVPIPDINQAQPVVTLEALTDNRLQGTVNIPTTRIVVQDVIADVKDGRTFSIDVGEIFQVKKIAIPQGMNFVASKNGEKVYPVQNKSASKIKLENRIYFKTLKEALDAGYRE